jgi:hypothetical protein
LPLLSVTVQVTMFVPEVNTAGALLVTVATPQLSAVTGEPNATFVALHPEFAATTRFEGQVMVGAMKSRTITNWIQVAVLPLLSTAVQVTALVPEAKMAGALFVTVAMPQLSEVTGVPSATLVALQPELAVTVTFEGQEIVGGVWSRTTTSCWQVAVLPLLSTTVQVTVFVPSGNAAGALLVKVATPQLSLVTGAPKLALVALQPEFADRTRFDGQVMVGRV